MNRRGQALVEFVLILPVFLFIVFAIYDFGMIFNRKNVLLNNSNDIVSLYESGKNIEEIKSLFPKINIKLDNDNEYSKLEVSDTIKLVTPGLNRVFGNPYKIKVERYIPNENE